MTKGESAIMKGVAILLMVWGHLFFEEANVQQCTWFFHVGDLPFVELLTRATNPVAFFLVLSGYGLYTVESKNNDYNIIRKIKKLYVHYWISLVIFVTIGAYVVGTNIYPGTFQRIVENITAWHTTWNGEIWFFFPYVLLALSSKWIFRLMDKINIELFLFCSFLLTITSMFCISRYGDAYFYHNQLAYMPILYFNLLFSFTAGAWMAKYGIVERLETKVESKGINKQWLWFLLVLLVALRCCFNTSAFHSFYAITFIILFVNAPRWKLIDKFLAEMGKRSTSIWFAHTYFCYYLFHDFIYGFKYPILIFIVLLICSYLSAVVIDEINKKVSVLIK